MPRRRPGTRLADLADAAVRVFIARGYRRTQVADVAEALGVAKGTIYLYVKSKEALFDLALRRAAGALDQAEPIAGPRRAPAAGRTLRFVRDQIRERIALPRLEAALARRRPAPVRGELEGILRELYDLLERNRTAIKLLDRCAHDYPELAAVWYAEGRGGARALLERWLANPARRRSLRPMRSPALTARIVIELVTFWAVHRHWDPVPQAVEDADARETVVAFVLDAVVEEAS